MAGRPLRHPEISQVNVAEILHALADPIRLGIVCELMKAETDQSCVETIARVGKVLAKSTCSQHYQILREAGLIHCERKGVELCSRLRLAEVEERFPGLLKSVLAAYEREKHDPCL